MADANIFFLIGMPAVGKSFWAGKIAAAYQLQFIDMDTYIADQENASIPALFAKYGENGFRDREQKYLNKIIKNAASDLIIACGGGTPCFADNMQTMKNAGTVIYLHAETSYLLSNLEGSTVQRPLLNNRGDLGSYLQELLQKRKNIYGQAHHILHTKDISLITFEKIITSCTDQH